MKVDTNKDKIEELLIRGVEAVYPTREWLSEQLASGRRLTIYTGYDPTADTLHLGHGITLMKLRQLQELGHKIIMLIGDFTGMIGDPTDKTAARTKLTRDEVLANCKNYKKQAANVLSFSGSNKAELKYNSKWLGKMSFGDVLELASHFTVQQMMERDMFQKRIEEEKPIHVHEFMYPLMQGYDSVAIDVYGDIGGNDQMFNMMAGRTLMKAMKDKEKFVLTMKLLADESGKKMGKTEGNMIALSDGPEDMFGKVMSWTDGMIVPGFELCTMVSNDEVESVRKALEAGDNPRDYKMKLASEIVRVWHGEAGAEAGKENFANVIQQGNKPDEIPEVKVSVRDIVSVLVEAELCSSKSQARRDIDGGGVKVNDEKVTSYELKVNAGDVIQKGKRHFVRLK